MYLLYCYTSYYYYNGYFIDRCNETIYLTICEVMGLENNLSVGRELFTYLRHSDDNNNNTVQYAQPITMILCNIMDVDVPNKFAWK